LKHYAAGYLLCPLESAPREFWMLSFPLPWRGPLEQAAKEAGLDSFLVAALIRQESEFDPNAISRAKAYGLTQILPSTGRQLARQLQVQHFSTNLLFDPEINLKLGTQYLRAILTPFNGEWEPTLAAYNAGGSRASAWLKRAQYREPAEFVESIPFAETRNYVQIVLRNADLYRRLYGTKKNN
jgi:soluble lytic murein transglycosylase